MGCGEAAPVDKVNIEKQQSGTQERDYERERRRKAVTGLVQLWQRVSLIASASLFFIAQRARLAPAMSSATQHVALCGFGYLEPIARPIRFQGSVAPELPEPPRKLPPKLAALTERLAVRSNWLSREADAHKPPSPCKALYSPPMGSRVDSDSSYYKSGTWPRALPPTPTTPRVQESTALMRRHPLTSEWHARSPSPTRPMYPPRDNNEEPLHKNPWRL